MNQPLVTIITLTYKHEAFIGECIESALAQTYDNWELIIVDDCSPDRTMEVIARYRDPRIRVVQKKERGGPAGLHVSYNTALSMAKGELIAVLEGDDYWPPDKLAIQVPYHQDPAITLSWGRCILRVGDRLIEDRIPTPKKPCIDYPNLNDLLQQNIIRSLTVIVRKDALQKIGGFWQPLGSFVVDYPTWLKLSISGKNMYIPAILGFYRRHENQITEKHSAVIFQAGLDFLGEVINGLDKASQKKINTRQVRGALFFRKAQLANARSEKLKGVGFLLMVVLLGRLRMKWRAIKMLFILLLPKRNRSHLPTSSR